MGQKNLILNTMQNFNCPENFDQNNLTVYVTYSKKEAFKLKDKLINNTNNKYCIFTLSENPSDTEYYFLPRLAFNYTKNFISDFSKLFENSKNKLNILFCFDDLTIFALKEKKLYDSSNNYLVKKFFLNLIINILVFK